MTSHDFDALRGKLLTIARTNFFGEDLQDFVDLMDTHTLWSAFDLTMRMLEDDPEVTMEASASRSLLVINTQLNKIDDEELIEHIRNRLVDFTYRLIGEGLRNGRFSSEEAASGLKRAFGFICAVKGYDQNDLESRIEYDRILEMGRMIVSADLTFDLPPRKEDKPEKPQENRKKPELQFIWQQNPNMLHRLTALLVDEYRWVKSKREWKRFLDSKEEGPAPVTCHRDKKNHLFWLVDQLHQSRFLRTSAQNNKGHMMIAGQWLVDHSAKNLSKNPKKLTSKMRRDPSRYRAEIQSVSMILDEIETGR